MHPHDVAAELGRESAAARPHEMLSIAYVQANIAP